MADFNNRHLYPHPTPSSGQTSRPSTTNLKRKNARVACENCKRRKLKCSGEVPCEACTRNGAPCAIDGQSDQRRKQALKRKLSDLEDKEKLLEQLLHVLRDADDICAAQLIDLVRNDASVNEIRAYLDTFYESESKPEMVSAIEKALSLEKESRESSRPRLDSVKISEKPIFRVPAAPWTTVTSDDDFVSHLISLWFTWAHPYLNWIDRDLFIRDMQSGDMNAKFCSPFLVNVILADACAYSDYPEAYGVANGEWSRGLHFYQEAKLLLGEQEGKISIVNVQGLCGLYVVSCMVGKDRTGWVYYGQLAYAAQELSRKHRAPREDADEEEMEEIRAVDNAMWGIFNFASLTALAYQKGPLIPPPRHRHRTPKRDVHQDIWHPFPTSPIGVESHRECLFTALCDMGEITHELSMSLFRDNKQTLDIDFARLAEGLYARLQAWFEGIPDCLSSVDATPHVMSLHLNYHTTVQTIFGCLKGLPTSEEASESEHAELERMKQRAQERCIDSARLTADLVDQQRQAWGLEYMLASNIHWFTVSMYTLLDSLSDEENQEAFLALSIAAEAASHRWVLARGMLRLVQLRSIQMEVSLPSKAEALFSDFEARVWTHQDRKALSSQYPQFSHSTKRSEVDKYDLDTFLEKFDDLHVTRKSSEESDELANRGDEASSDGGVELDGKGKGVIWSLESSNSDS